MDKAKRQQMRISDQELEQLKAIFADNEDLLRVIRNLFLGLEVTDEEKQQIKTTFANESTRKLMRKQFLPELQSDIPLGQNIDLWMTVDLKDKDTVQIQQIVEARIKLIEIIDGALNLLENPDGFKFNLMGWRSRSWAEGADTSLIARNTFISHIESQLAVIKVLSGLKTETVEETKKRLLQDSSK